ncbi:MAG: DUF4089 domain-containing protein [Rubrivivax sp.]
MDVERYADAAAQALDLPLAPEHRPGVLQYLQMVAQMAPRVMDFSLSPAVESGNAFRPVGPEDSPSSDGDGSQGVGA